MKLRIITGLIIATLAILGMFFLSLPWFSIFIGLIVLLGLWEWTKFVDPKSRILSLLPTASLVALVIWIVPTDQGTLASGNWVHMGVLLLGIGWWLFASLLVITYPKSTKFWLPYLPLRYAFGVLSMLPFFCSILMLRSVDYDHDIYQGGELVFLVCLLVWSADTGAYFSGKKWGRHKMSPRVSPNKTIEGLIGGIVLSLVVGWLVVLAFDLKFTDPLTMLGIMAITVVMSVFGDLIESMLKRVADIKDSSRLLPGHGGVLDRIDSLVAAFPVFTFFYFLCQ